MIRRNIDFFAVFFIAIVMLGLSQAASLRLPDVVDSIRTQNAVSSSDACPLKEILSHLAYSLNR